MKPKLPYFIIQALLIACGAVLTITPAFADVPEGYTPVVITDADQLADYTESDYIAFIISTDITDNTYRMTGANQYWTDNALHTCVLNFEAIKSASDGGVLSINSELVAEHLLELSFSHNASTSSSYSSGGAIHADASSIITFNDNESVTFCENTASTSGGAIDAPYSTLDLTGNEIVSFSGNAASGFGGAVNASGASFNLTGNETVIFSGNTTSSYGGAIMFSWSQACITGNGNVTFCGNTASWGGAIYATGSFNLTGNGNVTFSGNSASSYGGAINAANESFNLTGNGNVTFSGNTAQYGGAIRVYDKVFNLTGSESVIFSENAALYGGAIECSESILNLTGNKIVTFRGNAASTYGGAIFLSGDISALNLIGNEHVVFRGNYEVNSNGNSNTYRLRSVYARGCNFNLSASAHQDIVFYDTLYAASLSAVSFNAPYEDKDGVTHKGTGDIVFSGKYAVEDLAGLKAGYTLEELASSMTTEVYATTNLYGGRLRIEDGAIYKGNGINVAAGSNATLRLAGGTLEQSGYTVLLNDTTTLDLEGSNSITASTMEMRDGSTLSFNTGATEGEILNLDSVLKTGVLNVTVSGDLTKEYALLQLADVSLYDFSQWNSGQVNVSGSDFEHLIWKDGILSYKPWESSHTDLDEDTEVEDFGGGEGVEVEGGGHKLTVKHPVDLVHLAMNDGVVRLEGENNNVVRITLTEDGTLELAAGAGLKVGNIVSMVANGSADLVISGDIEINDIKAYGKPGNKGTLSYVNMTTAGDYTIENMTLSGSLVDIGEGTTMYLVNVDIHADTRITDDAAWLDMVNTQAWLNPENTKVVKSYTTEQEITLFKSGETGSSITLAAGAQIVELTSSMFDTVTLTGTDLWLDMTAIAEATYNADYFTLQFKDLVNALIDVDNLKVYATLDGETYKQAYAMTDHGTTTTLYFQVPEPTSSTLSLLALAALAARRRRK